MAKHILIIDDDPAILDVIKIILEDKGYRTTVLADSLNIFEFLDGNPPDLILLDIWMSGIDGVEITRKLKRSAKYAGIPVILISANTKGESIAKEVKANGYIAKPFEIDELLKTVEKHLIS